MKYPNLNDVTMPQIALGTWAWGSGVNGGKMVFGNVIDADVLKATFDEALQSGFYLWDTAPVYGMGTSEKRLGEFFAGKSPKMISTKFMPFPLCPKFIFRNSVKKSLKRLQIDAIDIFWIHTSYNSKKWIKETIPFIKANKIKHIGVSNHNLEQLKEVSQILAAEGIPLSAVQNHYSMIYRASETQGVLEWCTKNDVVFFAYMILEQGALTGVYNENKPFKKGSMRAKTYSIDKLKAMSPLLEMLRRIAEQHSVSITAVVIAWAIHKNTVPLIGVTKQRHVTALVEAKDLILSEEELLQLEQCSQDLDINTKGAWEGKASN